MKLTINGRPSEVSRVLNSLGDDVHVNVTIEDAYVTTPFRVPTPHKTYRKMHKPTKIVSAKSPVTSRSQTVSTAAKGYWSSMTPQQRIEEMAKRRAKGQGVQKQGA